MREIKFRAWDYNHGVMRYGTAVALQVDINGCLHCEGYADNGQLSPLEIMQFTDLHDRHGKEIYEGDILFFRGEIVGPVKFECAEYIVGDWALSPQASNSREVFEVIGNIHENPELLEVSNV